MTTFVSVGNATQPFDRLIAAVGSIASELPQPVIVQHGNTTAPAERLVPRAFMEMTEFISHIEEAELLIMHAGAGSVIHAVRAGKVPVVMPRRAKYGEHVDDHQLEFARALADRGRVVIAEGPDQLTEAVDRALELQRKKGDVGSEPAMVRLVGETLAAYARRLK